MQKGTGHHGGTITRLIQNSLSTIFLAGQAALGPENDVRLYSKYPQIISGVLGWLLGRVFFVCLFIMKALLTSEKED